MEGRTEIVVKSSLAPWRASRSRSIRAQNGLEVGANLGAALLIRHNSIVHEPLRRLAAPKAKNRQFLNSVAEGWLQVPAIERLAAPFWRSVDACGI
jgi:hypothetical protein